jgi:dTDP-4-amino-4,6-dideoxygalactose transaminase
MLSLPMFAELTGEDVTFVAEKIKEFAAKEAAGSSPTTQA